MKKFKKHWFTYIRDYRFHSIFVKNLLLILGVITLPFISVLVLSFYVYSDIQESETRAYTDRQVAQITEQVKNLFDESRMKAVMLGMDDNVKLFSLYSAENQKASVIQDIFRFLSLYHMTNDVIDSVYVYAPESKLIVSEKALYEYDDFYDSGCMEQLGKSDDVFQYKLIERDVLGQPLKTLSIFYHCIYSAKVEGIIVINLDVKQLQKEWDYGETVSIEIRKGEEILYRDSRTAGNASGKNSFFSAESLEDGVELRIWMDTSSVNEKLRMIWSYIALFIGIMFFVTFLLVFHVSVRMFNPVSEVLDVLKKDMPSGTEEGEPLQKRDEWTEIMGAIGANAVHRRNMELDLAEKAARLKKAQAVALQAQINPHFINNTMETINWMAIGKLGGNNEISQMLNALSSIMRVSLENTDTFVTLEDEVKYAETYLFIQKKRCSDRFFVVWKIPEELLGVKIIKMVLQPILENAITYGIIPYENEGRIEITAERKKETVALTVADSGLGITSEQVEEINHSIQRNVIRESRHIGLSNVNQRIILAFGEEYGLCISSEVNRGTRVSVTFPYQGITK